MQTRSSLRKSANDQSNDRLIATIKPRGWSDPLYNTALSVQPSTAGHDFSHVNLFAHDPGSRSIPRGVQAKLTVGAPNDQYEQEADRVAAQVMSMPDSAIKQPIQRSASPEEEELQTKPLAASITPLVQREAMPEEEELQTKPLGSIQREGLPEEEELQTKPLGSIQREGLPEDEELQTKPLGSIQREGLPEDEELQTKRSSDGSFTTGSILESHLDSSKGQGSPLPDEVRSFMEPRFGADFSQVRVHTDSEAIQMNQELGAQAFAHGSHVYYGAGKAPAKDELTGHELTHVLQQTGYAQVAAVESSTNKSIARTSSHGLVNSSVQCKPVITTNPQTSLIQRVAPAVPAGLAAIGAALSTEAASNAATVVGTALAVGTSAAQAGAMSGGVQAVQMENGWMSSRDQRNLELLTQYRLINAYVDRYKRQHPDQFTPESRRRSDGVIDFIEPIVITGGAPRAGTPPAAAANPAGGVLDQAIMDAVRSQVQLSITEDLNNHQKTAATVEYIWSDDNAHTPDTIGTNGAVQFSQVKGTFLSETLTLSHAAKQIPNLNPPAENTEVDIRQFRGGMMRRGPSMSLGYGDTLTINLVGSGPVIDQAANNQHGEHTYATDWNWDGNTTQGNFTAYITSDGTPSFRTPDWQGEPDDNSWI